MMPTSMNSNDTYRLTEEPPYKLATSELSEGDIMNQPESNPNTCDCATLSNAACVHNPPGNQETDLEKHSEKQNDKGNQVLSKQNHAEDAPVVNLKNSCAFQNGQSEEQDSSEIGKVSFLCESADCSTAPCESDQSAKNEILREVVIKTSKPLCADYQSDSDSESIDSESDSSTTSTGSSSESECATDDSQDSSIIKGKTVKGEKKLKGDLSLADLPPIENLKISVPEDACVEIGIITSIVETLVIVESYKGTSALDIDTILFLDYGRETLGKVFDILGPVSEPVYAVRFNSQEQIKSLNIKKDMKVYYAPKTEHTTFVFMSEVLKNRGSDASWKDNTEAPPEFQDFSDDEEERLHKNKQVREFERENPSQKEQSKSRKRPFNRVRQTSGDLQGNRFRNPDVQQRPIFQRNPFTASSSSPRSNFRNPLQIPPFPYNLATYSGMNPFSGPPHVVFPHRFQAPPFPTYRGLALVDQSHHFQQPFYQQRTNSFPQAFGAWGRPGLRPPPPPPPPPPIEQRCEQPSSEPHT